MAINVNGHWLLGLNFLYMQQDTLRHPEMSPPFGGPVARAAEPRTAKPVPAPPGCLALAGGGDGPGG